LVEAAPRQPPSPALELHLKLRAQFVYRSKGSVPASDPYHSATLGGYYEPSFTFVLVYLVEIK